MTAKTNWHAIAWKGLTICKGILLLLIFSLLIHITFLYMPAPYHWYVAGMILAVLGMAMFIVMRMSTFKQRIPYDTSRLVTKSVQLEELLIKLSRDIGRFEEGSSYFFNGVRMYKYCTMILSAISTILLGLSFKEIGVSDSFKAVYPEVAKNIAFVIGTIVTVYTAIMTFWNIERYWLQNKTVANKLTGLRDDIENLDRANKLTPEIIQQKFDAYQAIKGEFYKYWQGALSGRAES